MVDRLPGPASAQILIWSLPKEEGAWVRLEGAYRQTRDRQIPMPDREILDRSELTISSVAAKRRCRRDRRRLRGSNSSVRLTPNGIDQVPSPGGHVPLQSTHSRRSCDRQIKLTRIRCQSHFCRSSKAFAGLVNARSRRQEKALAIIRPSPGDLLPDLKGRG